MITDQHIDQAKQEFEKALTHLQEEYAKLQAGRANPSMVEGMLVESYGTNQPLKAIASITIPDPKTLQIQPWDKSVLAAVEKAIRESDLGLNPVNSGNAIMLNIPPLTEERRTELAKVVKQLSEDAKVSIRNSRQTAHTRFKEAESAGDITEDDKYGSEKKLQEVVDEYNKKVEDMEKAKEEAIMTV